MTMVLVLQKLCIINKPIQKDEITDFDNLKKNGTK